MNILFDLTRASWDEARMLGQRASIGLGILPSESGA